MNELPKDIVRLMKIFPGSFINHQLELILIPKYNIYFRMDNVETVEELKCKVLEYLSRPSCKGVRSSEQKLFRGRVNSFLETSFGEEDMVTIYTCLGNSCDRERTIAFIRGGFDLAILSGDMDSEKSKEASKPNPPEGRSLREGEISSPPGKNKLRICTCGHQMMQITSDVFYCNNCGRLLDSDSLMFPGDGWFTPPIIEQLNQEFNELIKMTRRDRDTRQDSCVEKSDAILSLIGNVHPVGETNTDDRRYENLKLACDVLKHLVCAVREVSVKCEGHGAYSINRAGEYASKCLVDLNIPAGYRDE